MSNRNGKLLLLLIAYGAFVVLGLFDGLLGVAWSWPERGLRDGFALPVDALGLLLLLSTAGYILASLLSGRLVTRYGVALLLIASTLLALSGRVLQGLSPSWLLVVALGPLAGLGMGLLDAGMNTFAAARFRPRLLNWLHASFGIGTTLGSLIMTGLLTAGLTWRSGFWLIGLLNGGLLVAFVLTRGRWRLDETTVDSGRAGEEYAPGRETLRLPIVWFSIAFFFLYTGLEVGIGHWLATLLIESRGLPETTAGLWATYYWGSFTAGRIVLGFVETRLSRLVRLGLVGVVTGLLLLLLNVSPLVSLLGIVLAGASQAPIFPALIADTPARVGRRHAPNAIGFQIAAAGLGVAILPAAAGWLGDGLGLETIPAFLLAIALAEVALHELLLRRARPKIEAR